MEKEFIPYEQALELKELDMKLYTKEMFLIAAEKCEVSMIDANHIMKYIDEYVTPIELPSDEEIGLKALDVKSNVNKLLFHDVSFQFGAKWVIEHIEKQK